MTTKSPFSFWQLARLLRPYVGRLVLLALAAVGLSFLTGVTQVALTPLLEIVLGSDAVVSDHTWGWELGAGVGLRLSEHVHLSPGARFVSLRPSLEGTTFDLDAVALDLGVIRAF